MAKGQAALEYPFNILLYVIVILVVIGLILTFQKQIVQFLPICNLLPAGCQEIKECTTATISAPSINAEVLETWCKTCWDKTGKIESKKNCLCYVISGDYLPIPANQLPADWPEYCEIDCKEKVRSVSVGYDELFGKVIISCIK